MKVIIFLLVFMLVFSMSVKAQDSVDISVSLIPSGVAKQTISLNIIADENLDAISYLLESKPYNIKIIEGSNEIEHILDEINGYNLIIYREMQKGEEIQLTINLDLKDVVDQSGKQFIFSNLYSIPEDLAIFNLAIELPPGFILSDMAIPVSPIPFEASSNGRAISLNWGFIQPNNEIPVIILYERGFEKSKVIWPYLIVLFIIILLFGVIYFKREKRKFVIGMLSDGEKELFKIIEKEKKITQKEIVKRTGHSKSKVSKIISRLESKELIKRKSHHNTHLLTVSKKLRK